MTEQDKKDLLDKFKKNLQAAELKRKTQDVKIAKWRREYDGKPYGNEEEGKSKIVSRDIKKQSEWQHATLIDPFVSSNDIVKAFPVTREDAAIARQNQLVLNTQFCRQFNRFNFMTKAVKLLDIEGTAVIQCGWEYESKEVTTMVDAIEVDFEGNEFISGQVESTELVVLKNKPTAIVRRNEDVFIDPTCMDDLDNCQFVIVRYETDLSTLKQEATSKGYKNLDKIKLKGIDDEDYDYDFDPEDETNFKFEDDPRKKLVVHEYWGNYDINGDGIAEPIVCSWVNDTVIRLQENPYPDKKHPFIIVSFNSVPFQMYGEANAELIGDNQKVKTSIIRGLINNMAQSTNGQKGIKKGALDTTNKERFINGQNFEYSGNIAESIFEGKYNELPVSAFNMLAKMDNDIESVTGVKSFSGGISGSSLGSTATGARGALDATSTRRLNIVRNISENLVKVLMRKWMSYNVEFLSPEEIERITNEPFVETNFDDPSGRIDIDIEVSTAEDNAAKRQELGFLLQTLGPNEDPTVRREIMADIYELMRMPDKAARIREFQPQPDPVAEQIKQMELQNAMLTNEKLKAEIYATYAKAYEDEADKAEKLATAAVKNAQARKLNSEADYKDLQFVKEDNQIAHQERLELEDRKRLGRLDELAFQKKYGGPNEELAVSRY